MHHPTDRMIHTTAFVLPDMEHWLERGIAQWAHPMKDRSDDPSHHERMLLSRSTRAPNNNNDDDDDDDDDDDYYYYYYYYYNDESNVTDCNLC